MAGADFLDFLDFLDFCTLQIPGTIFPKRGRPPDGAVALTDRERMARLRAGKNAARLSHLAVLDMETDPFGDGEIQPFCAELYSDQFGSIVIWDNDHGSLIEKLCAAIEALPDSYTIYAHNGGKFDYMFLVHRLRGVVRFKGRAIMSARIGNHELRDSLHILPERLAAWKKDVFDYHKMHKKVRHKHRDEILAYLHSDCVYLFDFIKRFTKEFGLKISIGQAAFAELRKHHKVSAIKETMDEALRPYFLGGRVECIAGAGLFKSSARQKPYRLYDVNSMYPYVMATREHPISPEYVWHRGLPNENTIFLDLSCKSYGAMFKRLDTGELCTDDCEGRFHTTIWEYRTALKLGLIENVKIHWCIDNLERANFAKFIVPMYERRQQCKTEMKALKAQGLQDTPQFEELKKEDLFLKYLLNNSYGKFAQNPRKYKEYYYTDHGKKPEAGWFEFLRGAADEDKHEFSFPVERSEAFDVWARPSPGRRFNNVGTAASITGAARAVLLEANYNAVDAIYGDTDSLICRELLNTELDAVKLGAWDLEETFDDVIITGKKTYCCQIAGLPDGHERRLKVRSKGADLRIKPESPEASPDEWRQSNALTWKRYIDLLNGDTIESVNFAPTFRKTGEQYFMTRRIRATAPSSRKPRERLHRGTGFIQDSGAA